MASKPQNLHQTVFPRAEAISFDVRAFDEAIVSQGIKMVHYRAMRCPIGLTDQYDNRRPHDDHSGCSNGFLYTKAGELTVLFTGNGNAPRETDIGSIDGSSVQVTCQRFYDETEEEVHVLPYDRLFLAEEDIVVPTWHTFEAHVTGRDKLHYPVVFVQDLVDSEGISYKQGKDFEVVGGQIVWGSNRPKFDAELNRGSICSVRFCFRPHWYIKQLMHEVRVTQAEEPLTGDRKVIRMPQAMVLQREYIWEKAQSERETPESDIVGKMKAPRDGQFGPR